MTVMFKNLLPAISSVNCSLQCGELNPLSYLFISSLIFVL